MRIRLAALTLVVAVLSAGLLPSFADAQTAPATTSSLIVKVVAGLTTDQQAEVVARNGGTLTSSIPALRLLVVSVLTDDLGAALARYPADPQVQSVEENKVRVSESVPSDLLYANQWALPKIGWDQVFGVVTPTGSAKVALLDTGVDAAHPELTDKVLPGTSILDGSNGMTDPSGHGTWLAGIIAAQTNTIPGDGIAGVAYAGVKILPVTVLNANGEGQDSDVIAGVIWAADHGADVILMAFSNPGFSPNLQDAIDYAWSKNVVVVAAVGNNASAEPTFPAGDRGVMGVAATDQSDGLASFSNEGQAVFIAAPGVDIQTIDIGDAYTVMSGTSTSAAVVAGAAALMKAMDPALTNGIIVGRLARNTDPAGTQDQTGNGRVNLPRSLADTSTEFIQPAGAAPVGGGGPFVGPYVAGSVASISPNSGPISGGTAVTITGSFAAGQAPFSVTFGGTLATNVVRVDNTTITADTPAHAAGPVNVVVIRNNGNVDGTLTNGFAYFGPATKLAFTTQPSGASAGQALATQPVITVQDAGGNTVTNASTSITLAIGTNPSGGTLSVTTNPLSASSGVATFAGVSINQGGTGYTLQATAAGLTSATSNAFDIAQMRFTSVISPTSATFPESKSYTVTVTNVSIGGSGGGNMLGCVKVAVPAGFGTPTSLSVSASGNSWTAPTVSGGVISTNATTNGNRVDVSETVAITFTATATAAGTQTWTTSAFNTIACGTEFTLSGTQPTVTVAKATTTTTAANKTATFSSTDQIVTLTAAVTSTSGTVNQGSVTFTVKDGSTVIGSTASGSVTAGAASASYTLPGGSAAKTYTIEAAYTSGPSGNFADSSDNTKTLTVSQVGTTTAAANKTANFSAADQVVALTATVTSGVGTVNQGSVTFTVKDGSTVIGSTASGSVTAGSAGANYTLPGGSAAKTYTIEAAYTNAPSGNFADSSDNTKTLTVNKGGTTTAAANKTATFSATDQSVALTATVTSTAGAVNQGSVTFTVKDGATVIGSSASGSVTAGAASANYTLPGGSTAKTYTIEAAYTSGATGNFDDSSDNTKTLTVGKAGTTTTAANKTATFSLTDQTVTLTATVTSAAGTLNQGSVTFTVKDGATIVGSTASGTVASGSASASYTLPGGSAAKTYTIEAAYTSGATGNFADSSDNSKTLKVNPAPVTVSITGGPFTYDGNPHAATVTTTPSISAYSVNYGGTTTAYNSSTPPTNADTYTVTVTITDSNYVLSGSGTGSITIAKADPIVTATGNTCTYNGGPCAGSGSAKGVNGEDLTPVTVAYTVLAAPPRAPGDLLTSAPVDAGTYQVAARFAGNTNYNQKQSAPQTITINKAATTTTVTVADATYDGSPHGGTATVTGPASLNQALTVTYTGVAPTVYAASTTAPTNAGTYSATASYAESANYFGSTDTKTFTINKANPTVTATGATCTYNGSPCPGTGTATGVLGEPLTPVTIAYTVVAAPPRAPGDLLTSAPVDAGTYQVAARFAGNTNYNQKQSAPQTITINKAATTTTVMVVDATYDGNAHGGSATVTGPASLNQALTVTYTGVAPTVYAASTTAPTNAGTYSATASYAESANYFGSTDTKTFTINKAEAVVTATGNTCTYNGSPCSGSGTATGVLNEPLTPVTLAYTVVAAPPRTPGDLLTSAPADAGTYQVAARFAGNANYNQKQSAPQTITITKAATSTVVTVMNATYNGNPHGGSATVTGPAGLNQTLTVTYTGVAPTVYAASTTAPTNAGSYSASATYAESANYLGSSDTKTFTINKAEAVVTATGNACTYNGSPCAGSGTATGVLSEPLTPVTLAYTVVAAPPRAPGDLLTSAPVDAGTYQVAARFAGNANYNQKQSAPQTITINKAATSTVVTVMNATYDGNPHGGSATVTGPAGLNQALTVTYTGVAPTVYAASTTAPTNAGSYSASATYAESANYLGSSDTKTFTINKKTASVTPDNNFKLLGAADPVPLTTGTLNGFLAADGVTATYSRTLGETVGAYTISATLSPTAVLSNYNITYNTAVFTIIYNWSGFFQPVDNYPTLNTVNSGRAIPVKFSLHGNQGLAIFASGYPASGVIACDGTAPVATIEETVTAGASSLSYDPGSDQYIYVWKTDKAWAGQCRQLIIKLNDTTSHVANFKFTK